MLKKLPVIGMVLLTGACAPITPNGTPDNYRYDIEVGITDSKDRHVAIVGDNLVIQGNGSHKGTPGIYQKDGTTVMPFVDRGPCAAGSPCWTGVLFVPREGLHEWTITATVHFTGAAFREAFEDGGNLQIYCRAIRDGELLSLAEGTGIGYAVTPIQHSGDFQAVCSGHN